MPGNLHVVTIALAATGLSLPSIAQDYTIGFTGMVESVGANLATAISYGDPVAGCFS